MNLSQVPRERLEKAIHLFLELIALTDDALTASSVLIKEVAEGKVDRETWLKGYAETCAYFASKQPRLQELLREMDFLEREFLKNENVFI